MANYKSQSRFYDPSQKTARTNFIVSVVFIAVLSAAAWYSLTSTLTAQQVYHCEQGWQPACESLK
jgi:hypothetical protein